LEFPKGFRSQQAKLNTVNGECNAMPEGNEYGGEGVGVGGEEKGRRKRKVQGSGSQRNLREWDPDEF
jgi:hypothetical protein